MTKFIIKSIYHYGTKLNIIISSISNYIIDATEWPDDIKVTLRFPAVMRTPMLEHPLRISWRTNLLFPLFPMPGPREPNDLYGGKMPGMCCFLFIALQFISFFSFYSFTIYSAHVCVAQLNAARFLVTKVMEIINFSE